MVLDLLPIVFATLTRVRYLEGLHVLPVLRGMNAC